MKTILHCLLRRSLPAASLALLLATATAAEVRALEQPEPIAASGTSATNAEAIVQALVNELSSSDAKSSVRDQIRKIFDQRRGNGDFTDRGPIVQPGQNVVLKSNEIADSVVVFGGNATIDGVVRDAVVCIGGNLTVNGLVGDGLVCIGGNVRLNAGSKVAGDVVPFGGNVNRSSDAVLAGTLVSSPFGNWSVPGLPGVGDWLGQCVFKARPLAPGIGWMWLVMGALFLVDLMAAVLFARPVGACVGRLEQQPVSTFFIGLLWKVLLPLIIGLLVITVVGIIAIPFLLVALVVAQLIGKVALCQYFGQQFGRQMKLGLFERPLVAFVFGWVVITALYLVPVLGLLTLGTVSIWALGAAMIAAFGGVRRERPPKPALAPTGPEGIPVTPLASFTNPTPGAVPGDPPSIPPTIPSTITSSAYARSGAPEAVVMPRAGLWPRVGAGILDLIVVIILVNLIHVRPLFWILSHLGLYGGSLFPLVAVAYFTAMIAWRGTTLGGIVLNLKVARLDGRPVSFGVALVRALSACLSTVVLFLGFIWIVWDPEKQGWHDKIAGTVVVRLPKTQPLICL